jgi:SAM-dependent methyltransferase
MQSELKPKTFSNNGRLWGTRARDWSEVQEGVVRPVYEAVFARVGLAAGGRYLDMGCGAGMALQLAADRGARVAGIDAAPELLAIARERVPHADVRVGDLEELPFDDSAYDLVTAFNSVQYAGNPSMALREASRVLAETGTLAVVVWGEPADMEAAAIVAALGQLMPPPPPGAPGPFALSSADALRGLATDAGLMPLDIFDVDSPWQYPDTDTALRGLNSSGVAVRAMESSSEAAVTEAHLRVIAPFERPDGSIRIGARFRCLLARP